MPLTDRPIQPATEISRLGRSRRSAAVGSRCGLRSRRRRFRRHWSRRWRWTRRVRSKLVMCRRLSARYIVAHARQLSAVSANRNARRRAGYIGTGERYRVAVTCIRIILTVSSILTPIVDHASNIVCLWWSWTKSATRLALTPRPVKP